MELRQLSYFVNVARLKSFSEASRVLYISQSTLSQQIQQLENELGVSLLIRNSRKVQLSDYGEQFYPSAVKILQESRDSITKIQDVQNLNTGGLMIGVTYSFYPLLNETLKNFIRQYPGIKLDIHYSSMEDLMKKLENNDLDVVLSYKPLQRYKHIESHTLFDNRLCLIVSKNHPLASESIVRLSEIEKYPLALPAKGLQARNIFDCIIAGQNARLEVRVEVNDINVLLDLVSLGGLVTVLSEAAVNHLQNLVAIPIDSLDTTMEGSYHLLRDSYVKNSTKKFLKLLIESNSFNQAMQASGLSV